MPKITNKMRVEDYFDRCPIKGLGHNRHLWGSVFVYEEKPDKPRSFWQKLFPPQPYDVVVGRTYLDYDSRLYCYDDDYHDRFVVFARKMERETKRNISIICDHSGYDLPPYN